MDKLEAKPKFSRMDGLTISCLIKKLEDWDAEFKKQHNIVLDFIEDESKMMEQEQSI